MSKRRERGERSPGGRFLLRIDAGLHKALRLAARDDGISLNEYCARKLASPGGSLSGHPAAAAVVAQAAALFGGDLVGVLAFGSWAREELADRSDVDLIIVVGSAVELTRELYRRWDASPLSWEGRPVDAHFIHVPAPGAPVTGVWAEAAVDGIVLFERGLRLTQHLIHVRRQIAAGQIVRRVAHGQPYWIEGARSA